ncbi:uncharacterized protein LOC658962 isoform X1 [Tribolium castaneum]|uniref:F-box domain-containing protein n=2 Tax=Tribolium castaneum TaxID=7070 RepID=A0A139WC56_TRICA|nr:PREDICTED: uncharacterized protein LOC658962 [Tribolium castaneum]KYB25539.1 hypothetical protein TcasGA2_TC034311 [Tribolium castaneum]|eukprot:XP_015838713.1 PREDICTED: uncharacterized protein LOC658962 [Tribolium castaneum]
MQKGCWKVDDNDEGTVSNTFYKRDKHHKFSHELWTEMYKSKNTGSKAVYIDLEDEEQRDEDRQYSQWSELPDLLLEKIFSYLSIREKYYASLVCKSWYRAFHLPYVWSQFVLEDNTLTRGRFNYYSGWQYVLDHLRTQNCLSQVGRNFRKLTFEPMLNFYNLYEFMNMVSWCTEQSQNNDNPEFGVGKNIHTLKFTFPCNMTNRDDTERIRLFGTGGKLLAALKRLMSNLKKLKRLELIDLMLDPKEAQFLLDEVCESCCMTLNTLSVINTTRVQYELFHVGVFLNLQVLYISPQNLGDDIIELLSHTKIRHIHILQNRYTPNDINMKPVDFKTWKLARKNNPELRVHLQIESLKEKPLIWQQGAPVSTVLYDSPHIMLREDALMTAIEFYKDTLRVFGHKNIPRFHRNKSFYERVDSSLMLLVRQCLHLNTLIVTERISTATALLLAYTGKNLKCLFIRGNAVIIRCDWPQNPDWSDEFYTWLKINSRSYELVEQEISQIMGRRWQFLSDKQFKKLHCNLHEF